MNKLMYKPQTKSEKWARWILLTIMTIFTIYLTWLRMIIHPHLNKYEFTKEVWGNYNWIYLVIFIITSVTLYIKSNWTNFKKLK